MAYPSWSIALALALALAAACSASQDSPANDGGRTPDGLDANAQGGGSEAGATAGTNGMDGSGASSDGAQAGPHDASAPGDGEVPSALDAATPETLCETSGGTLTTLLCCSGSGDFPNTCAIGACGCGPAASAEIQSCNCPNGCYEPVSGCTGGPVCTPGQDQTCNDNLSISSLHGSCRPNGTCKCAKGFTKNPDSGKCL